MRIVPLWKMTENKGDRLWWVRCCSADKNEADYKMTIPIGMTICTGTDKSWEGITMVLFYFFCFSFGFGYGRAETT